MPLIDILLVVMFAILFVFGWRLQTQIKQLPKTKYDKVLISARYGVDGIQTIDVTAILESIGSNIVVHNYHFDPEDKLLPGTKKYLYLTYALATKEILAEGDNIGEFDIVEWVEEVFHDSHL